MGKETKFSLGKISRQNWVVLLLLGVLLAVIALPTAQKEKEDTGTKLSAGTAQDAKAEEGTEAQQTNCEKQLEDLLSQVEGIGRVRVIVRTDGEEGGLMSGEDSGGEGKVTGVLVAAQGGDNSVTVQNIQEAVMALFQVEAHKIKVMKMK